jgi:thiamine-phosphate pyrophosphorylase
VKPLLFPRRGLYAITADRTQHVEDLASAVAAAIRGGARVIQYRSKNNPDATHTAQRLLEVCKARSIPLIINDDIELAQAIGADGVHLGKDDDGLSAARSRLGPNAIIGISCYASLERALTAQRQGASYVAFGRFFPSQTKPGAPSAPLGILGEAKRSLDIPIVAIGGIDAGNGKQLIEAGANLLAVIDAVFNRPDPEQSALEISAHFS